IGNNIHIKRVRNLELGRNAFMDEYVPFPARDTGGRYPHTIHRGAKKAIITQSGGDENVILTRAGNAPTLALRRDGERNRLSPCIELQRLASRPAKPPWIRRSPGRVRFGCFALDRKSTRLNSSHVKISYAVF